MLTNCLHMFVNKNTSDHCLDNKWKRHILFVAHDENFRQNHSFYCKNLELICHTMDLVLK